MEEKLELILICLGTLFLFMFLSSQITILISKALSKKELVNHQIQLKNYYLEYKDKLENKVEFELDTPLRLNIPVYSDDFSNNTELRKSFLQVCYILRDLAYLYNTTLEEETEEIFKEIRQLAYANDEPFERCYIK